MKTRALTEAKAAAIYDILIEECGAEERLRDEFMSYVTRPVQLGFHEYRFMGSLGFGGKFHNANYLQHPYVSCYPEDHTAERSDAIAKANRRIEALS